MNKTTIWAGVFTALLLGPTLMAWAGKPAPAGEEAQAGMSQDLMGGMGGHIDKWKEKLELSDAQAGQLKALFQKQKDDMKLVWDQMKIDMDTLKQKVDSKASDGDLKKVLDSLRADQKKMQEDRQKLQDKLRSILTPTQQAKFVLGMREKGREMLGKWSKQWKNRKAGNKGQKPAPGEKDNPDSGK